MKNLFLILILISFSTSVIAAEYTRDYARDGFPPLQKSEATRTKTITRSTESALSSLEKKIFNRTYDKDLPENRLARLEEQILGTIQSGDVNTRYKTLAKAVSGYTKNRYSGSSYCGTPVRTSGWRGLAGTFRNFGYSGYPTGLSPQIYSPYINTYGPDYQRDFYSNKTWNYHNTNYGTGSGVRIINY